MPAILLALTVGMLLGTGLNGRRVTSGEWSIEVCSAEASLCADPATRAQYTEVRHFPAVDRAPDVPLEQLAWLGAGALAAVLLTVGVGLLFLRVSTTVEELRTA
ncbi:hypothetical protein GCM10027614_45610 [Micromonospora vulcania]